MGWKSFTVNLITVEGETETKREEMPSASTCSENFLTAAQHNTKANLLRRTRRVSWMVNTELSGAISIHLTAEKDVGSI